MYFAWYACLSTVRGTHLVGWKVVQEPKVLFGNYRPYLPPPQPHKGKEGFFVASISLL